MKVKQMVKRMFAVGAGVAMLGATAMGALAADLSSYPSSFVTSDGNFNGYIVLGSGTSGSGAALDNFAAIEIASNMWYRKATSASAAVTVEGENAAIEGPNNPLNIGESFDFVQVTAFDHDDLPTTLAKGTYTGDDGTEYGYEQEINFLTGWYELFADNDYKNKAPTLGVRIPQNTDFVNYSMKFTKNPSSPVTSSSMTDFVDTTMNILGQDYEIITATNATKIKLVMLSGAEKDVMRVSDPAKKYTIGGKEYEVKVDFIDATNGAKFTVNGEATPSLAAAATRKLKDGTLIAVKEILTSSKESVRDQVEFFIGAQKLTLEDTELVELNDEDVDQLTVNFIQTFGTETSFSKIFFTWKPDNDIFITEDQMVSFPAFGTFDISYKGLKKASEEEIKIANSGNTQMDLSIPLKSGTATVRLFGSNATQFNKIGGDGSNEVLLTGNGTVLTFDTDLHEYFPVTYVSGTTGESYLLEVSKVSSSDGATFKDVVSGTKWEDKKAGDSFSVGSSTLTLNNFSSTDNSVNFTAGAAATFNRLVTPGGLLVYLPVNASNQTQSQANQLSPSYVRMENGENASKTGYPATYTLMFREEDKDENVVSGKWINVTLGHTSSKTEVTSAPSAHYAATGSDTTYEDTTNLYVGYVNSSLGTKITHNTDPSQDTVTLTYYGEEAYGQFFVLGNGAVASSSAGGELTRVAVVDAVKLDSEVADAAAQNLIVVGGPCVNSVSAKLLASGSDCAAGFNPGEARLKMFEQTGGKLALLVAGYEGADTKLAGKIVAHRSGELTGEEVVVKGKTRQDATITAPAAKPVAKADDAAADADAAATTDDTTTS